MKKRKLIFYSFYSPRTLRYQVGVENTLASIGVKKLRDPAAMNEPKAQLESKELEKFNKAFEDIIVPALTKPENEKASDSQDALDWLKKVRCHI